MGWRSDPKTRPESTEVPSQVGNGLPNHWWFCLQDRSGLSERVAVNRAYAEQWKKMRRVWRRLVLAYVIGAIGLGINHFLIDSTNQGSLGVTIFTAAWLSFLLWTALEYWNIRCPRCGQPWRGGLFQIPGPWRIFLRHRCPHCGLELP